MFKKALAAAMVAGFLAVTGCAFTSQPIQTFSYDNVNHVSVSKMRQTIIDAATKRGWAVTEKKKGVLTATLVVRSHTVVVDIPYSSSGYEINYVSSINMNAENGTIHNKYNHWVNNLYQDVNRELNTTVK